MSKLNCLVSFQWSTACPTCLSESRNSSRRVNRPTWPAATTWAATPSTASSGTRAGTSSTDTCPQKIRSSKRFQSKTWKLMWVLLSRKHWLCLHVFNCLHLVWNLVWPVFGIDRFNAIFLVGLRVIYVTL